VDHFHLIMLANKTVTAVRQRVTRDLLGRRPPAAAVAQWCADAQIPELTTLAETIETWWPAIEVFLTTGLTNARTEGTNGLIKQVKRAACGFRNRENYRRRVRLHCTRHTRRLAARNPTVPV
jgi:hypothetical protein